MEALEAMRLSLSTMPASDLKMGPTAGTHSRYRKELIKAGNYLKASTGQAFEVTTKTLHHWADTFRAWVNNGNKVPIPLSHDRAGQSEANQGYVHSIFVEEDSLYGILSLADEKLAITTDVSIFVPPSIVDGKGNQYIQPITHVALCVDPVIPGLKEFEPLSLSLGKGDSDMDLKKYAAALGLAETAQEDQVLAAIEALKVKGVATIAASHTTPAGPTLTTVDPLLVNVISENRTGKLITLLNAGIITPAMKDLIHGKYIESKALTLSLSKGGEDGFDLLMTVLTENKPVTLGEASGPQALELAHRAVAQKSAVASDIDRRRKDAGMDN